MTLDGVQGPGDHSHEKTDSAFMSSSVKADVNEMLMLQMCRLLAICTTVYITQ